MKKAHAIGICLTLILAGCGGGGSEGGSTAGGTSSAGGTQAAVAANPAAPTDPAAASAAAAPSPPASADPTGTSPAAIGTTPTGTAPTNTAATGTAPTGTGPTGTAPTGTTPTGTAPTGTAPTGTAPTGTPPTGGPPQTGTTPTATNGTVDIAVLVPGFSGTRLQVNASATELTITGPDLPNHQSAYWPTSDPNYAPDTNPGFHANRGTIVEQSYTLHIPRFPKEASTKSSTPMGPMGVARNGVAIYNQYAGTGQPLGDEIVSFDQYNGHPDPMNFYHYHVEPTYLTGQMGKSTWVGLLADGFPVYGPTENGVTLKNSDLDAYHGHTTATPEFPNGIYHYHITAEAPYINGGQFFGAPGTISH